MAHTHAPPFPGVTLPIHPMDVEPADCHGYHHLHMLCRPTEIVPDTDIDSELVYLGLMASNWSTDGEQLWVKIHRDSAARVYKEGMQYMLFKAIARDDQVVLTRIEVFRDGRLIDLVAAP